MQLLIIFKVFFAPIKIYLTTKCNYHYRISQHYSMALWAHFFLFAAALCGSALSGYVEVDDSLFQHYGGGLQQATSYGTQFKESQKVVLPNGKVKEKLFQVCFGSMVVF